MNNSFFFTWYKLLGSILIFIILTCILFIPTFGLPNNTIPFDDNNICPTSGFVWPAPGYTKITSPFGKRHAPTSGASTYHKGMDVGAPEGANLIAVTDGQITFLGFLGGGGYTITLSTGNLKISYCHVSPRFLVKLRR